MTISHFFQWKQLSFCTSQMTSKLHHLNIYSSIQGLYQNIIIDVHSSLPIRSVYKWGINDPVVHNNYIYFTRCYWYKWKGTCPSHMSISGVLLVAFSSLKWNSFPSKNCQGRHMFQGIGAPHTSLANTAVSTPDINREAKWIPRGRTLGSFKTKDKNIINWTRTSI